MVNFTFLKDNLVKTHVESLPWKFEYNSLLYEIQVKNQIEFRDLTDSRILLCRDLARFALLSISHNICYLGFKLTEEGQEVLAMLIKLK